MRIGELSRRSEVSERALRYYEEQGLLRPRRRPSGYREYEDGDLAVVRRIRTLLAAGLSTQQIAQVLPCIADDGGQLAPTCERLVAELTTERDRIGAAIDDLETTRRLLENIINAPVKVADPAAAASTESGAAHVGGR